MMPEYIVKRFLDGILLVLDEDTRSNGSPSDTILGSLYGELALPDGMTYFNVARTVFSRRALKKIKTKLSFDGSVTDLPVVYVTSGSNDHAFAPIGDVSYGESQSYDSRNHGYKETRFSERSSIVIMSNSIEEISLIYHTIRAMLLVCKDTLSMQGLENIKFGGGDVRAEENLVPKGVFVKAITLAYDYDLKVRSVIYANHNISDAVLQVVSNPMPTDEEIVSSGTING